MLTLFQSISYILSLLDNEIIISANGMISRMTFHCKDRNENFYMLGSMGLAGAIGLGISLNKNDRKILIFDGDGNLLMGLGVLAMVGESQPKNFIHILFDNEAYGSTGGQRCISDKINLKSVASSVGYKHLYSATSLAELEKIMIPILSENGPSFLHLKVVYENSIKVPRIPLKPNIITDRFIKALKG